MCASPRVAPAAILAVPFPRVNTNAYIKGGCLLRFWRRRHFVRHCSRVIRADSPLKTAIFILRATQVIAKSLALAREAYSGIGLLPERWLTRRSAFSVADGGFLGLLSWQVAKISAEKRFPPSRVRRSRRARHFGAPCLICNASS